MALITSGVVGKRCASPCVTAIDANYDACSALPDQVGSHGLTAAIPMENPYCSCKANTACSAGPDQTAVDMIDGAQPLMQVNAPLTAALPAERTQDKPLLQL